MQKCKCTVNGKSFTGLNFHGFCGYAEKRESFSNESFALSIIIYYSLALYRESITVKIHILWIPQNLAQRKFPRLRYVD